MKKLVVVAVAVFSTAVLAQRAPPAPAPPAPPPPPGDGMGWGLGHGRMRLPGIPPAVAQKVGIAPEVVKKVRDLSFEANEALIGLEADLKRAQLELEKALSQTAVDDSAVMGRLEAIAKAELAVRKNRMGLMLKIRKAVGPEAWEKLQAELPPFGGGLGLMGGMGGVGGGTRREVRVIRHGDGREDVDVHAE